MRRLFVSFSVLACALILSSVALAGPSRHSARTGALSGTIVSTGDYWLSVQTSGRRMGVTNALTRAADAITRADYPYIWGGGHPEAGVASALSGARGRRARQVGFDCSGSVAAVLSAAGLWAAGSPVPNDAGVIAQLLAEHLIVPGAGVGPLEVTLYDDPGIHIFMNIDGRFFGTSDGGGGGSARGGAGWLYDGAPDAYSRAYKRYHFLPWVLRESTTYGHIFTFQTDGDPSVWAGAQTGDRVLVAYSTTRVGTMLARLLNFVGAQTLTGTVSAVATDGSSFTTVAADGSSETFATRGADLTGQLQLGDQIQVVSTVLKGVLVAHQLTVTAAPVTSEVTGTIQAIAADGSSLTIQTPAAQQLTISTGGNPSLISGDQVGDAIDVSYLQLGPTLLAQQVTDNGPAQTTTTTSTTTPPPTP
jgi:hypothetical protein